MLRLESLPARSYAKKEKLEGKLRFQLLNAYNISNLTDHCVPIMCKLFLYTVSLCNCSAFILYILPKDGATVCKNLVIFIILIICFFINIKAKIVTLLTGKRTNRPF